MYEVTGTVDADRVITMLRPEVVLIASPENGHVP
jgi:hypothetical protein